ncbi:MAG: hypothetical protein CV045_11150 [Cyanobacteria bacterium M5B4]|nr:MAG: hypothetical protein CV045_11150 [Cyanobacteria bacterium M5B4]
MNASLTQDKTHAELSSLVKTLFVLQQKKFSGMLKFTTQVAETSRNLEGFLFFHLGNLTLAERKLLSTSELVLAFCRQMKVSCIDSVMDYAAHRVDLKTVSAYDLFQTIVTTRVVNWEDIEKVAIDRMVVTLERFLPHNCNFEFNPQFNFDIAYGEDHHGIPSGEILQKVGQRQKDWKQYQTVIHSLDAIPRVRQGVIETVTHAPTRNHLQQWVDGKHSFADIAEALAQDPLLLAPLYFRWVNEGLIEFIDSKASSHRELPVILSVDDSPIVQTMIRRSLCESYEVVSAGSAMEALGILNRRDVDLILLDVTMPEIDGFEFCRTIRKISRFKDTPVIMLTAKDGLIDRAKGHLAGTNRYLTKPINSEELLEAIREYV